MTEIHDYISYIDTDSLFLRFGFFLENQGINMSKWKSLEQDTRVKLLIQLSKAIEKIVNQRSYDEVQRGDYNSSVVMDDFGIVFKQEIICTNILHLGPKMYAFHTINDEGWDCDKIDAKGIEIVRSSSPKVFRSSLKLLLEHLLKGKDDEFLRDMVEEHRRSFYKAIPEDISVNTGVNKIGEYINEDNMYCKGTPYHVKGVANYHFLLKELGISARYESIKEGDKCKVIYLKKNKYNIDVLTYYIWPKELDAAGIIIDYDLMIEKYFTGKAHILLDPINRKRILEERSSMDDFF